MHALYMLQLLTFTNYGNINFVLYNESGNNVQSHA